MNKLKQSLAERWKDRSPVEVANRFSAPLYGSAGEWDLPKGVTPKKDLLYLAVGIPDETALPKKQLETASQLVFSRPGDAALRYGFGLGPADIRSWLAKHRSEVEGVPVSSEEFQMTNGSSGAIDLIVRSLINPGEVIIAENPTYMGTLHNFRGVGAEVRFVDMDEDGIRVDALETLLKTLKQEGKTTKLLYTISTFHNPTGWTLSTERRLKLLELALEYDLIVLDDEAYRELWFDEVSPPPSFATLADNYGVITTGTFSKTVATGIRVGWIHARSELLALFSRMRFAMGQNQVGLRAMSEFLDQGEYRAHIKFVRELYQDKRDILNQALQENVSDFMQWHKPQGGFYFWAKLRSDIPLEALWRTAVEEGIAVNPGSGFSDASRSGPDCIRIAYAWTPKEHFPEAARRLRIACERVLAGDSA